MLKHMLSNFLYILTKHYRIYLFKGGEKKKKKELNKWSHKENGNIYSER